MKYWKQGFYLNQIEGSVEITDDYWQELLEGQSNGKQIVSDANGYPILADPPAPSQSELDAREIASLKSYLADTDYIYPKCLELGLDVDIEYADVVSQRKSARTRIQELIG
jgi:hypothetical protein